MDKKEIEKTISKYIGNKVISNMEHGVYAKLEKAMDVYARKYHAKENKMETQNIKIRKNGVLKMTVMDYVNRKGWELKTFEYIYPGVVRVIFKNVSDHNNARKNYRQEVSDVYANQISKEVFGVKFEDTNAFDEKSLSKREKVIK